MGILNKLGVLISIALLCGCSTYGYKTPIGENTYAPVDYHKVKLFYGSPDRPYEVIGIVSTQGGALATEGDMLQKLLKSGAALGADGVIVNGQGNQQVLFQGAATTAVDAYSTSPGHASALATTTYGPDYIANMPTNKGLAIKFTE